MLLIKVLKIIECLNLIDTQLIVQKNYKNNPQL